VDWWEKEFPSLILFRYFNNSVCRLCECLLSYRIHKYCSGKKCDFSPLVQNGKDTHCVICEGSGNGDDGAYAENDTCSGTMGGKENGCSGLNEMRQYDDSRDDFSAGIRLSIPDDFDTSDTTAVAQLIQSVTRSRNLAQHLPQRDASVSTGLTRSHSQQRPYRPLGSRGMSPSHHLSPFQSLVPPSGKSNQISPLQTVSRLRPENKLREVSSCVRGRYT